MILGRFFGRSKQVTGKKDPLVQEEVDAAEPPTGPASIHEPFLVSPRLARENMSDLPDRLAENAASIVNHLALNNVSNPSTKSAVPGKRKRQETDLIDESPKKRVAKGSGTNGTSDEPPTTSTNSNTGHGGRPNRASSETVKEAPGKLPRPKTGQLKRGKVQNYPAVQESDDIWDPEPSPVKQVENPAAPPPNTTTNPPSPKAAPRPRGRPLRVGPSPGKMTTSTTKGQGREMQNLVVKPRRKGRPERLANPEVESREGPETTTEAFPQKTQQKAGSKIPRNQSRGDHGERAPNSEYTRSSAAANGYKDAILNANTDLTKKPERDARRAAKQRKSLEPVPTPASARVDSLVEQRDIALALRTRNGEQTGARIDWPARERDRENSQRARYGKNNADAKAHKAGDEGQKSAFEDGSGIQNQAAGQEHEEEKRSQREGRRDQKVAMDRADQTSSEMDEGEEANAEAEELTEEEQSDFEGSSQVHETDEEEEEKVEVFNQDWEWKTVLEGACSINGPPKLLTKTIKLLIDDVREARNLYKQLLPFRGIDHDSLDEFNDQLKKRLRAIEDKIRDLSEAAAATKGSEMIRDIYARAIPAMVFLLQSALASRCYHSDEPYDLETLNETVNGLTEIVRLQKMAIRLCEKAKRWKAKPVPTSQPIVKPTVGKIFPRLKDMEKAFSEILVAQQKKKRSKQNAVDYSKRQKEHAQSSQRANQDAARKNENMLKMIRASREREDEARRKAKRTLRQIKEDEARARRDFHQENGHVESRIWSDAEDIALYYQLEKGYEGGLTSTFIERSPVVSLLFANHPGS